MVHNKSKLLLQLGLLALLLATSLILGSARAVTQAHVYRGLSSGPRRPITVEITGTIDVDTTWTADDSPYIVTGDLMVSEGVTLTIEPGVEVRFETTDDQSAGADPDKVELIVAGTLMADGVTFTSNADPPAAGDWYGIRFLDSSTDWDGSAGSIITNSTIEYGSVGISIDGASPLISSSVITGMKGDDGISDSAPYPLCNNTAISSLLLAGTLARVVTAAP